MNQWHSMESTTPAQNSRLIQSCRSASLHLSHTGTQANQYCKTWTCFVKHGFVKGRFVKHGFVKGGFVKHRLVRKEIRKTKQK